MPILSDKGRGEYVIRINKRIGGNDVFSFPSGVCWVYSKQLLYITDMHNHCVKYMKLVDNFPQTMPNTCLINGREEKLIRPLGITYSKYFGLCITDAGHNEVFIWDINNEIWIQQKKCGNRYNFNMPGGITADDSGIIFINDFLNERICGIDRQGNLFKVKFEEIEPQVHKPYGICYKKDILYVADTGNNRIIKYSVSQKKTYILNMDTSIRLSNPIAIQVDDADNLLVCEQRRIWGISSAGSFLFLIDRNRWNLMAEEAGFQDRLTYAGAVNALGKGRAILTDTIKGYIYEIQYFRKEFK